jgi:hypothetical protein
MNQRTPTPPPGSSFHRLATRQTSARIIYHAPTVPPVICSADPWSWSLLSTKVYNRRHLAPTFDCRSMAQNSTLQTCLIANYIPCLSPVFVMFAHLNTIFACGPQHVAYQLQFIYPILSCRALRGPMVSTSPRCPSALDSPILYQVDFRKKCPH